MHDKPGSRNSSRGYFSPLIRWCAEVIECHVEPKHLSFADLCLENGCCPTPPWIEAERTEQTQPPWIPYRTELYPAEAMRNRQNEDAERRTSDQIVVAGEARGGRTIESSQDLCYGCPRVLIRKCPSPVMLCMFRCLPLAHLSLYSSPDPRSHLSSKPGTAFRRQTFGSPP